MSDWNPRANEIFLAALELTSLDQRRTLIEERCGQDSELRAQVETLLAANERAGSFLEHPAIEGTETAVTEGDSRPAATGECTERTQLDLRDDALEFLSPTEAADAMGQVGPYEITEVIGRGGMGIVYKACDVKLNRVVAIKVLAPQLAGNATARRRFLREAQAAAAVTHQHVVTIHAVDEDRLPYLVMEFVDGLSLQEKIDRQGTLNLKEILRIGHQVASGLVAAHAHGVIHRDIKPANILLENGIERARITDFGLARAVDDVSISGAGEVAGTPQYMSPEQAQGLLVDARSDLFNLGCVLYAMCTGRSPFRADTTVAAIRRVCDDTPRPIREVNQEVPEWLVDIIDQLLEKIPDHRIPSAEEVADLLGRHLAHVQDPDSVPQPRFLRHGRVRPARGRGWFLAAGVLLLAIIGLGLSEVTGIINLIGAPERERPSDRTTEADTPVSEAPPARRVVEQGGAIDLLPFIDPQRDSVTGQWRFEGGSLVSPATGRWDRLTIPYQPPEEYDLEVTAQRKEGTDMLTISLVSGERQFFVGLDRFAGTISGLGLIDGKDDFANETTREQPIFKDGLPHKIICQVRNGGVTVTLDGNSLIDWRGDLDRLSVPEAGRSGRLELTTSFSSYHIYDLILRPVVEISEPSPRATITEVRGFEGHTGSVKQVALSRDGSLALSCSGVQGDRSVRLWEVATGREIRSFDTSGTQILAVSFSPDGEQAAGAGLGGVVRFWDLSTGELNSTVETETEVVTDLTFSPDGRHLLCTTHQRKYPSRQSVPDLSAAQLWDLDTEELLWQFDSEGWLETCEFLRDDEHVVVAGRQSGCAVHLLDRESGDELRQFNYADSVDHQIEGLTISHDGKYIATASELGYVYLWDVNNTEAPIKYRPSMGNLRSVAFSPDDRRLVCGSGEGIAGSIQMLGIPSLGIIDVVEHPGGLAWDVAYLPDGRHALSAGGWSEEGPGDYALRLWRLPDDGDVVASTMSGGALPEVARYPTTHSGPVLSIAVSPDGQVIATGSSDKAIHLLDRNTGAVLHELTGDTAYDLRFTADGRQLLSAHDDGIVRLWDVVSGEEIRRFVGHGSWVTSVDLSPDGRDVVTGGHENTIRLWDFDTGDQSHQIDMDIDGRYKNVFCVRFDSDGERFVSAHQDGTVTIWNASTREEITTFPAHEGYAYCARFSPDGQTLLTTGSDNVACLWNIDSGRRLQTLPHGEEVTEGEFLEDGRFVVTSSRDKKVSVWNVQTGRQIAQATALTHCNSAIAPLPDGQHLVSAGGLLDAHSKDGRMVWIGDGDYDIRLWRLPESVWSQELTDAAPSEPGAFVVLTSEGVERMHETLAAAVSDSRPGDTIEIHGDGPFIAEPLVLRHALTIRAGTGFQPVIERRRSAWSKDRSLLTSQAPLVVEGLQFKHAIDGIEKPRFLDTYDVEALRVSNCRFENAKDGYAITGEASDVVIQNCEFFVPDGFTVAFPPQSNGRWVIDNCVHVGTIGFFDPVASVVQIAPPDPENSATIELSRNTVVAKSGLYLGRFKASDVPAAGDALSPIQIHASSNLFDTWSTAFRASFQVVGGDRGAATIPAADAARLPARLVEWAGRNNAYPARGNLILLQFSNRQEFSEKAHAIELAEWVKFWGTGEIDSLQGEARFVGEYENGQFVAEPRPPPVANLRAELFRLHPDSAGYQAGPGGEDLGADIDLVGPGEAYERWKRTPQYTDWVNETRQLMENAAAEAAIRPESDAFVLLGEEDVAGKYASLADAAAVSRPGDTIEVRGDGPYLSDGVTITHPLTIRAAEGSRPVIKSPVERGQVLRVDAPLVLEDLTFTRSVPSDPEAESVWGVLIEATAGCRIRAANCRFVNHDGPLVRARSLRPAGGSRTAVFRNCELIARLLASPAWHLFATEDVQWSFENCVHTSFLHLEDHRPTGNRLHLSLVRNTMASACVLVDVPEVDYTDGQVRSPIIRIEASQNIFGSTRGMAMHLHQLPGSWQPQRADVVEQAAQSLIQWLDRDNAYIPASLHIFTQAADWSVLESSLGQDLTAWNTFWGLEETGSIVGPVRLSGGDVRNRSTQTDFDRITAEDFRLLPDSAGYLAGPGGDDLGADIDLVGPGAAYQRWKQTPEYQDWLDETARLMADDNPATPHDDATPDCNVEPPAGPQSEN